MPAYLRGPTKDDTGGVRPRVTVTTRPQVVQRAGGTTMLAAAIRPEAFMLAAIEATLTRTRLGCLALGDDEAMMVVQCPYGTTLSEDGTSIDVPGLGLVRIGDTVRGGGGRGEPDDASDLPAECGAPISLFFWQSA